MDQFNLNRRGSKNDRELIPPQSLKDAILDDDKKLGGAVQGALFAVICLTCVAIRVIVLTGTSVFMWLH